MPTESDKKNYRDGHDDARGQVNNMTELADDDNV